MVFCPHGNKTITRTQSNRIKSIKPNTVFCSLKLNSTLLLLEWSWVLQGKKERTWRMLEDQQVGGPGKKNLSRFKAIVSERKGLDGRGRDSGAR